MDLATLIGFLFGIFIVLASILTSGGIGVFINIPSIMITVGGTMAGTLAAYPLSDILGVMGVVQKAFFHKSPSSTQVISKVIKFAVKARRDGILALEEEADSEKDAFLKKGIQLAVDGTAPDLLREILESEISNLEERHKLGQSIFDTLGMLSPAFGMIGTLIGLVQMLSTMDDPSTIGPSMAVALITTFYGAVMANLFFIPISIKLKNRSKEEVSAKEVMIEGVLSIQSGDNPRVVEERLKAFLPPKLRDMPMEVE